MHQHGTNEGLTILPTCKGAERCFESNGERPNFWRSGSVLSQSYHVRERATRHRLLSLKRSRRVAGSGSLASIGMSMYLKNVVGFVPHDGAWLTIDGCLRLGFEDRPNGRFWRAPCKGGAPDLSQTRESQGWSSCAWE